MTQHPRFIPTPPTATINMRSIPAGMYLLRVTDREGKEYGRKVTIQ